MVEEEKERRECGREHFDVNILCEVRVDLDCLLWLIGMSGGWSS